MPSYVSPIRSSVKWLTFNLTQPHYELRLTTATSSTRMEFIQKLKVEEDLSPRVNSQEQKT